MTRRLIVSYVSIAILVLLVLEIPLGVLFSRSERRNLEAQLKHDALSLAALSEETLEGNAEDDLLKLARDYDKRTGARVVITDRNGALMADSSVTELRPRDFGGRPEIKAALAGREVTGTRHSDTLRTDLLYVAVPATSGGDIYGAVRITFTPSQLEARVRRGWLVLVLVGLGILVATTAVSVVLARSVSRPLRKLEGVAEQLASGDLSARAVVPASPREMRALAEAFNAMAIRLEQLVSAQDEFVADASHQLRTPLQALRLRLENLEASALEDATREDLNGALAEVARLGQLIEGLLSLAKAERTGSVAHEIDVGSAIDGRREAWLPLAEEHGLGFEVRVPSRGLAAVAGPGHLEQVLDNLIANAIEASPPGGVIEVTARRSAGFAEVHVIDRGPGLTTDERARATDRFWRAPGSKSGGSGLGLTIAQRLLKLDGGSLELREARKGGLDAVVRLRLP